jgi:hypothetical protein
MPSLIEQVQVGSLLGAFQRELSDALRQATQDGRDKPDAFLSLPSTLRGFVERFPVKIEGKPIDLVQHRYLAPVYEATRFDCGEGLTEVAMTGAHRADAQRSLTR